MRRLDYFFTIASPWAYLGHSLLREIALRHDVTVNYRPIPILNVFDRTGSLPLPKRPPARQRYRLVEMQRWRDKRGLPLVLQPKHVPFGADAVNLAITALTLQNRDPHDFADAAFTAAWADERDLGDVEVISALLSGAGHDAQAVLALARGAEAAQAYAANGDAAVAGDVFGAPAYVLDGEVFWGQDRLELLGDALASQRGAYRPL
jgi:2-hydroxychromene-2-carboxylate isomerase